MVINVANESSKLIGGNEILKIGKTIDLPLD
jgi:hypothetical protein